MRYDIDGDKMILISNGIGGIYRITLFPKITDIRGKSEQV